MLVVEEHQGGCGDGADAPGAQADPAQGLDVALSSSELPRSAEARVAACRRFTVRWLAVSRRRARAAELLLVVSSRMLWCLLVSCLAMTRSSSLRPSAVAVNSHRLCVVRSVPGCIYAGQHSAQLVRPSNTLESLGRGC